MQYKSNEHEKTQPDNAEHLQMHDGGRVLSRI